MDKCVINIAGDYTKTPGGRYIDDGDFSGQDFREKFLEPIVVKAKTNNNIASVKIIFDGGFGYPVSFLEEAFGGLARKRQI